MVARNRTHTAQQDSALRSSFPDFNLKLTRLPSLAVVSSGPSPMRMSRANELLRANPMAVRTLTGLAIRMAFSLKTVRTGLDHLIIRNLSDN